MAFAQARHERRQIALQVPAGAEEHGHDAQGANAFGVQRRGALGQRGPHPLEERERDALAGQPRAELRSQPLERARPLRVARAMRE